MTATFRRQNAASPASLLGTATRRTAERHSRAKAYDAVAQIAELERYEAVPNSVTVAGIIPSRLERAVMSVESCVPVIPSADLEKSLRLWVDGLGFSLGSEMRKDDRLIFCMLRKDDLCFMLNQRAGTPAKPKDYEGIRLYWAPKDIYKTRERLKSSS
jgi:hypothetical protein